MALKLDVHALRSYLRLIRVYELYILPNQKVSASKDHDKDYVEEQTTFQSSEAERRNLNRRD